MSELTNDQVLSTVLERIAPNVRTEATCYNCRATNVTTFNFGSSDVFACARCTARYVNVSLAKLL